MNRSFWKDRRVFLTGHTGFKGSWLSLWLQSLSADVVGYALSPPTTPSLFEIAKVGAGMKSIHGDIRDFDHLYESIKDFKPEIVMHMAAQSVVRTSYEDPVETYSSNVMGTVNLLEAIRRLPGKTAVVNVTSDKCYENEEWFWGYREVDRLGGRDPYSSSKACAEMVTRSFNRSFFGTPEPGLREKAVATARAGNVLGGGDWTAYQLVPEVIEAFSEKMPAVIRSPSSVRPWQHVLDCLNGYLVLAEALARDGCAYSEAWNFGPAASAIVSVESLVNKLAEKWPGGATWKLDEGAHPVEAAMLRLDSSKANYRLGWNPILELDNAIEWVVEWYSRFFDGTDARDICEAQIERFEQMGST
jgi:CDP-glucose 4,6-dehydratase